MTFIEISSWGWNLKTFSFLSIIATTLLSIYGHISQIKTIIKKNSGKSIPLAMHAFFVVFNISFLIYGFRLNSLTIIVESVLGIFYLTIYILAGSKNDSTGMKMWHFGFIIAIPAIIITAHPERVMNCLFIFACACLLQSPIEIVRRQNSGAVNPRSALVFLVNGSFWSIYAICFKNRTILYANVFAIIVMTTTLIFWVKYDPNKKKIVA
jgi:uncharacterized protein with PQ loop repeat